MVHGTSGRSHGVRGDQVSSFVPRGFTPRKYPLRHKLEYAVGLSAITSTMNSTMCTLVKNYTDSTNDPTTIVTNPKHTDFEVETGSICAPMSIIDKLRLSISFTLTKDFLSASFGYALKFSWMPIFFSFPEKLDAADEKTTTTVKAILQLTKDATKEDITPTYANKLDVTSPSERSHPASTANFAEVAATMNLTTDTTMEAVAWNAETFFNAIRYYTNKGALKACLGKTRNVTLTSNHNHTQFNIRKFVPKSIRRIMPYTFMAILIHVPIQSDPESTFASTGYAASGSDLGVKLLVKYEEWNPAHYQELTGTP